MPSRYILISVLVFWSLSPMLQAAPPAERKAAETLKKGKLPITISRETTYITEPLRADGYPDYLAALNQMASEGVTPENNAAAAIVQICGPEEIKHRLKSSKEQEQFYKLLGIAPLPDEGDYFVDCYTYIKKHAPEAYKNTDAHGKYQYPIAFRQINHAGNRPWLKEECPLVAKWLSENEKHLQRLVEASKLPRYYVPIVASNDWMGSCHVFYIFRMRDVIRALLYRAMLRLGEGKTLEAWDDLQACHRFARLQGQEPMNTDYGDMAITFEQMACFGDRQLAHSVRLTPEQAQKFCADHAKLPPQTISWEKCNIFDRFLFLDSICATARGRVKPSDIVPESNKDSAFRGGSTPEWNALHGSLTKWIESDQVDWDMTLRLGNR
jgi:hypothetical protein